MDAKNYDVAVAGESMAAKLLEPYDAREEDKGNLAVVKYAVWKLMAAHLHLEDTES